MSDRNPWLESLRASRLWTLAVVVLAAMTLAAGGAVAADGASKALKKGSSGARVVALQRALGITADGVFGPATRRAVRRFQRSRGLVVDGIAGPATLRALGVARTATKPRARAGGIKAVLERIAACESGGNPRAVSPDGRYRGKYQFSRATWRNLGGKGDPAKAPEAEQDRLAAKLYAQAGASPWPSCA